MKETTVGVALRGHPFRANNERVATEGHPYSYAQFIRNAK